MYSTCLFCSSDLGRNEAIEHFTVGRRLAFDAAKGRLWVVCPSCVRWNLTPLESRWEAIEEAERAYRETKLRTATEHIGLTRLKDGTELVRIGSPQLPEFAAWRYGQVFRKRQLRSNWIAFGGMGLWIAQSALQFGMNNVVLAPFADGLLMGAGAATLGSWGLQLYQSKRTRALIRTENGPVLRINRNHAQLSRILVNSDKGTWLLRLHHPKLRTGTRKTHRGDVTLWGPGYTDLSDETATRALAKILPTVNEAGAGGDIVSAAVDLSADEPNLIDRFRRGRSGLSGTPLVREGENRLAHIAPAFRLALEMSLHEADERRAMEGELHELEDRWREAEEIAAIADNMFVAPSFDARLAQLRSGNADER